MDSIAQIVLDKLQAVHDRAINTSSEKVFFLALYDFVVVFDQEEVLTPVVSQIMDMGQKENAELHKLERQALEEMSKIYLEISTHINENKITDKEVLDDLDSYRGYDEKRIESSDGPTSGKHGELLRLSMTNFTLSSVPSRR